MNDHTDAPLSEVLGALNAAAEASFETATPIPPSVHHSTEFHRHERNAVFGREWICIGRADEIPEPGDYLTHSIAGTPVLAVRQPDGFVSGFVNACAHRFACLMPDTKGSTRRMSCRYHAWTYDLAGNLLHAPGMDMKDGFDPSQRSLKTLTTEIWEGFLYMTLAEEPRTSLSAGLAPFTKNIVGRYGMAKYRTVFRKTMSWNANWKNLIENFIESYHVPYAHKKTFALHKKPLEDYVCGEESDHYCYHYAPQPSETGGGAAHPNNDRLEGVWRRTMVDFCIFPCHLVTVMPDYLWYISVQPDGVGRFDVTWGAAVPPEILADIPDHDLEKWIADFRDYMILANDEDKAVVEALHQGTAAATLPEGTLHPIERNLWQFTRYLARRCGAL